MTAGGLGVPGRYPRYPTYPGRAERPKRRGFREDCTRRHAYRLRAPLMLSLLPKMASIDVTWSGYSRFTTMSRLVTALNS